MYKTYAEWDEVTSIFDIQNVGMCLPEQICGSQSVEYLALPTLFSRFQGRKTCATPLDLCHQLLSPPETPPCLACGFATY